MSERRDALPRKAFTVPEMQEMYGLSRQHIYDIIRTGELSPIIRSGRAIRIPISTVEAWEKRSTYAWAEGGAQ